MIDDRHQHLAALRPLVDAAGVALRAVNDRERPGERDGQYALDLAVDEPLVAGLLQAGYGVLSEESGTLHSDRSIVAVVDPVDGSTNASIGLPWFATSICLADDAGPLFAIVRNHATGTEWVAARGAGAERNRTPIKRDRLARSEPIVSLNGPPGAVRPWRQFRVYGAAAIELCAVASGVFDGYVDFDDEAHGIWDYLGAALVCAEAGVRIADAFGRPLHHLDHAARRTPVAAADDDLFERLLEARLEASGHIAAE